MKSIIPEPMIPKPFCIHRMLKETHDTYTIELKSTNGDDGFTFSAGQFNMLYVFGVNEAVGNNVVIVAGGIGLAPLRPVLYSFISQRDKYGKIILLYGARTPEDLLYKKELESWRGRFDFDVKVTVDSATGSWRGNAGVVTTLIPKIQFDPLHTVSMICGPEVMIRYTLKELQNCGIRNENFFVSMERNMKCGICLCGHCQFGPKF